MPAGLKRASSAFLDSPVKPGNNGVRDGDGVIIMRLLNISLKASLKSNSLEGEGESRIACF